MLPILVVVLAVVALGAAIALTVSRRALAAARRSASTAATESADRADEVLRSRAELQSARDAADERVQAMEQQIRDADDRVLDAERRAADTVRWSGLDPDLAWELERARSERTWRFSVSPGPHVESTFAAADQPLVAALQIELDAAREEVGAVVDLDASLPAAVSPAVSVLTLRLAQELLADVVRRSESTVLHVHDDGNDVVIRVESVDEDGEPVLPRPLPIDAVGIERTPDGVRLVGALSPDVVEGGDVASDDRRGQIDVPLDEAVTDEHAPVDDAEVAEPPAGTDDGSTSAVD